MPVTVNGLERAAEELDAMARRAANLRPVLRREAVRLEELVSNAWAAQRSPGGAQWPAREVRRRRSRRVVAPRINRRGSGGLRNAHDASATRDALRLRVPVPYASFQFFGTEDIPPRNALPVIRRGGRYAWIRSGPAGRFLEELVDNVRAYIVGRRRGR